MPNYRVYIETPACLTAEELVDLREAIVDTVEGVVQDDVSVVVAYD